MNVDDWNSAWIDYRGPVRVVLDDLSIIHGAAVATRVDGDQAAIRVESPAGFSWHHPRFVWPARWRFDGAA